MTPGTTSELATSAVIRQRLVGLAVLLAGVFLLSVLLRGLGGPRAVDEEGLQTVVVPLGTTGELPVATATLPEESAEPPRGDVPVEDSPEPAITAAGKVEASSKKVEASPAVPTDRPAPAVTAPKQEAVAPKKTVKPTPAPVVARWYVVLGSFSDAANAKALVLRARRTGVPAESLPQRVSGGMRIRVRAGPFKSDREAQAARASLIVEGMTNARVVKEP